MQINKHVELWPDETSSGRLDSPWIVSLETSDASTTRYIDYDYGVAKELALELGSKLNLPVLARNRLGEIKILQESA